MDDVAVDEAGLSVVANQLLARYAWAIDSQDYPNLAEVFTDDVVADYEGFACQGVAELVETMERLHRGLRATQHLIGSVLVTDATSDAATVRSHVRAVLVGERRRRLEVGASYVDRLRREPSGWRIAERRVRGAWMDGDRSILPWMGDRTDDARLVEGGP